MSCIDWKEFKAKVVEPYGGTGMKNKINIQEVIDDLYEIQNKVWEFDIPSPTVPEYIEHHEQMHELMAFVGDKILKWKEAIE